MNYDIVIVGGGPSGLALAQCCSFIGKKVLIIEKENDIGGCHRVRRIKSGDEFLFNEHGPRVYSSTYKVFITLLKKMDLDFYDLFVQYKFNITTIGKESIWTALTFGELFMLFSDFIALLINDNYGKDISMKEHLINLEFSEKSKDMIDRICRLTDGANSSNYTLHQFLQLLNQQFFYGLYQPNEPNDIGLFKKWREYLERNGVAFLLNASVEGDQVTYHGAEHLGVAVDTERGLLVPVIRDAGDLNMGGVARRIVDVAARTRDNKISPDELGGGTFTITNTGSRGALFDTPIINQPQVAILGIGSIVKRPMVMKGTDGGETIAVRSMVYLALSYDHRIVDGADAARFLVTLKERLEEGRFESDLGL